MFNHLCGFQCKLLVHQQQHTCRSQRTKRGRTDEHPVFFWVRNHRAFTTNALAERSSLKHVAPGTPHPMKDRHWASWLGTGTLPPAHVGWMRSGDCTATNTRFSCLLSRLIREINYTTIYSHRWPRRVDVCPEMTHSLNVPYHIHIRWHL